MVVRTDMISASIRVKRLSKELHLDLHTCPKEQNTQVSRSRLGIKIIGEPTPSPPCPCPPADAAIGETAELRQNGGALSPK